MSQAATREVAADEADLRLDRWLRRHRPGLTQGAIEKACRTGQIRIDGHRAEAGTRLTPGQTVRIPPLPATAPARRPRPPVSEADAAAVQAMVLHRDADVIALDKPAGLPVQGGPGIARHLDGMLDALRFGAPERPRLVHRLDRETSGLILLARTQAAAARLAAAFRGRDVRKTYWAVVAGRLPAREGRIDLPLARIPGALPERVAVVERGDPAATTAITDFRVLDAASRRMAWLELAPLTGRTHQLRVHCASGLGTPILGDTAYSREDTPALEGAAPRLHLHARALAFPHPGGGGTLELTAPLPAHMRHTFALLGFDA
jgi:23S rRNA pseudouridine955/2504/2580 synthase